ncbi:hypothetical protein DFA_09348 [Cavenderia fasciculata]|uniref:COI1 F-box domain-containing protein n=1 Tax=Cavenderia fasciculata TaxID=261658 RepID=F4Q7D6_CACFS|nr:uncharacterized protein DFA_09348 [Cavenderia fasciculata]EGG16318.1 hypothetical protein DFA_09348 [Cavenderia fasciculata]|eukprot:XP_004354702.1 hypothetical protein DFA_09348 [Cavenderia fasciculata]
MSEQSSSSSSSSPSLLSLAPRGGLSDLTLLKIINDLECNQDIVCLLMTCKAYYREFKKMYAQVITFKGIKPDDTRRLYAGTHMYSVVSSHMQPFKEIFNASLLAFQTKKALELSKPTTTTSLAIHSVWPTRESILESVEDPTQVTSLSLNEFSDEIKDIPPLLTSITTMTVHFKTILPRFPSSISQWPSLTSLTINSYRVLPVDVQFPPSLTHLEISYACRDVFSVDLSNLTSLTDLLCLRLPLDPHTMKQSFFPPNLQHLSMDYRFFGSTKPPPKVTKMSMGTSSRLPPDFFPHGLLRLELYLINGAVLDPWTLPHGLEILHISHCECTVSSEFIPDSVKDLWVNVINPEKAIFPSGLVKFATSTNYESPFNYPPTLRKLLYERGDYPPPIIYLPTSLEKFECHITKIQDTSIFILPTTMIINNDNSSITDNPLHFILPHRLKKLNIECSDVPLHNDDCSIRIDQIINCSNVEHIHLGLTVLTTLDIYIRRLDNGYVMMNLGETFFGGIYRQQRRLGNIIDLENKSPLDFRAIYLNFRKNGNHIHIYPSNTPIKK